MRLCRILRIGAAALCISSLCWGQSGSPRQNTLPELPIPQAELLGLLPRGAALIQELRVDFEGRGSGDVVLTYSMPGKQDEESTMGLKVLRRGESSGWAVKFEEDFGRLGQNDSVRLGKVRSTGGKEGVVQIVRFSGAGTATVWSILASAKDKVFTIDPAPIRKKVLLRRRYLDNGYNGVTTKGDLVMEELPGYSLGQARCCPNRPSIVMTFQFTGIGVRLESVKQLPFVPGKD